MHAKSCTELKYCYMVADETKNFKALFTRHKLTRVRPGLKLTRVSFCRVNTANPGSTGLVCRVNTTNPGSTRVS